MADGWGCWNGELGWGQLIPHTSDASGSELAWWEGCLGWRERGGERYGLGFSSDPEPAEPTGAVTVYLSTRWGWGPSAERQQQRVVPQALPGSRGTGGIWGLCL